MLVVSLRASKGDIRGVPALTREEMRVKDAVYQLARQARARVEDQVEMLGVTVRSPGQAEKSTWVNVGMSEETACE